MEEQLRQAVPKTEPSPGGGALQIAREEASGGGVRPSQPVDASRQLLSLLDCAITYTHDEVSTLL